MSQIAPDHTPVAQCIGAAEGTILSADASYFALLERERAEVVGRHAMDITYGPDRVHNAPLLLRIGVEDRPFAITKRYLRGDGSLIWVENHVAAFSDGVGPRRLVVTSRAVSNPISHGVIERILRAARQQIAQLAEAKRALGPDLAAAPSLEALLMLYLAEIEGTTLRCDELAARMRMAPSNVLRWLGVLEMRALVETEECQPLAADVPVRLSIECQTMLDGMLMRMDAAAQHP